MSISETYEKYYDYPKHDQRENICTIMHLWDICCHKKRQEIVTSCRARALRKIKDADIGRNREEDRERQRRLERGRER